MSDQAASSQAAHSAFYVTGGTIPPGSPSYISRAADRELLGALARGELCYVLNARQMGKSSLSVRTRQALEAAGTRTAFLDLQKFGSSATPEQWYRALLERIASDLKLRSDFLAHWRDNAALPPLARLFGALRDVALERIPGNLVVFLDEIDVIGDQAFKTDEFFGAIRQAYNERANDPTLSRLTFCLIGTVAPTDLIQDVRLSPFNIGTRIKLADLTRAEAAPLAIPLPGGSKTLDRVYWWASGHPYLTQRLCAELSREGSQDVDAMVSRLFFAKSDADVDENIKNVRNGLLRMGADKGAGFDRTDLLTRYGAIASGKRVPDDDIDGVCAALRLSGLVTSREGLLHVRNRVYAHLFDAAWVRANLPDAEVRRQRAAVAKARWQVGSIAAAVLLVMAGLLWQTRTYAQKAFDAATHESVARKEADAERNKAEQQRAYALTAKNQAEAERLTAQRQSKLAIEAKNAAVNAAAKAEIARQGEASAKAEAVKNAQHAQDATREALQQTVRADKEAAAARAQTNAANHLSYVSAIEQADQNIGSGNYITAQLFFDDAAKLPRRERGYEWDYLAERFHDESRVLKGHTDVVSFVVYSPDGKRLATASNDKTARIWDAAGGKVLLILKGHTYEVKQIAYSPDGKQVATASWDGTTRIWDAASGKQRLTLKSKNGGFLSVAFSPGGKCLATGGTDNVARIWDAASGKELLTLKGHAGYVNAVAFSPDGTRLATASNDYTVRVWDTANGRVLLTLKGHTSTVYSVAYSPDGKFLATAAWDNTARVWDVASGKELVTLNGHKSFVDSIRFSPDGKRLATGSMDGTARIWDAFSGKVLRTLHGHKSFLMSVAYSPDGKHLATASSDKTARIWGIAPGREAVSAKDVVVEHHRSTVRTVAYSPDGKHLATACYDNTVRIWDTVTGGESLTLKGHTGAVLVVTYSLDGKRLATTSKDKTVRIWNVASGTLLLTIKSDVADAYSIAFSPDGKRLATSSQQHAAYVWDAASGRALLTLNISRTGTSSVAFSPDGERIVFGYYDNTARVLDTVSGKILLTLRGHADGINAVTYSPDGKRILTGSFDNTARVWDAISGKELLTLSGHSDFVMAVAYSPNGMRLASAGNDNTARVWDAVSGKELLTLRGHTDLITSVAFSPDGKHLATSGYDKTARIWRKPTQVQLETMAAVDRQEARLAAVADLPRLPLTDVNRAAQALAKQAPDLRLQIAAALNGIAWSLVDPTKPHMTDEVARQALAVVTLAVALSDRKDGLILDTLAAAQFAVGDLDGALATERQAVALLPKDKDLADALKRYETLAKGQKPQ